MSTVTSGDGLDGGDGKQHSGWATGANGQEGEGSGGYDAPYGPT